MQQEVPELLPADEVGFNAQEGSIFIGEPVTGSCAHIH